MPLPRHSLALAPKYTTLLKPVARRFAVADAQGLAQGLTHLYQECFSLAREEIRAAGFMRQEAARLRSILGHVRNKVESLTGKAVSKLLSDDGTANEMLSPYKAAVRLDLRLDQLAAEASGLDRRALAAETSARKAARDAQKIMMQAKRSGILRMSQEEQQDFQLVLASLFA